MFDDIIIMRNSTKLTFIVQTFQIVRAKGNTLIYDICLYI